MIFLNLLLIHMLNAAAEKTALDGYCDAASETCNNEITPNEDHKLIFYDVNPPEGFNLRRDVYMRFAIMLAEAQKRGKTDWRLVLTPWNKLYHWKNNDKPVPWRSFFDVESLKSYAPVLELSEIVDEPAKPIDIDTLYVLQNFDNPFENGVFEEKWQLIPKEECDKNYDNISAKEVICVRFQGKISKLWELIHLHPNDKKVMFMHGEIPLHDNYGTKAYWDCRKSMKFNKTLVKKAKKFIKEKLGCDEEKCNNYIAIHWRRLDFATSRPNDVPSIDGTVKQIKNAFEKMPGIKKIFISTDASASEVKILKSKLKEAGFKVYVYDPSASDLEKYNDGGIAIIDQIICSHAAHFIGTHESTFTFRIQEEREILGFDSSTTFNRLCPDVGACDAPSIWKIIN
ncbi:GDP-fucose protein O-fucosyltransferase 2 [Ostrinia nubilalis]|uniref:GDP-fucose protein O-fucosyltransferase 2 n=1 Tax=Ostrinia nubilalis TaxID=29057 RepID=UPI0030825E17